MAPSAPALAKLDFKESIFPQGKRDTSDALLKRLKTLQQKLAALEQDLTDTRTLEPVRKPLIHQTILHHKDRGVRAYAACCLADLLRLYAPDAPYSDVQLRDIFQFFIDQLTTNIRPSTQTRPAGKKATADASQTTLSQRITDVPYYTEYYHLIENLATIKSVVLVCDVPGAEELMELYFTGFMEMARPDMNKTLMRFMRDILVAIIEEAASLPAGVMDCLVSQFENYASKPDTPSFQLTVDVCNEVADKLKRPFYAHFSEIQIEHGRDPSPHDLKTLSESHDLLLTINRFCPDTLLNAVPLLEENLKVAGEVPIRQMSVKTLSALFAQRPGAESPAKRYPSAWKAWLGRKVDVSVQVRLAWVEGSRKVLVAHPEIRRELEDNLVNRLDDPDERVRAAVCKVIGSLDYETALHHLSLKTLKAVSERLIDKKLVVQGGAAEALAKLWNLAYSEIEAGDKEAISQFAWIPQDILCCISKRDMTPESKLQIITIIKTTIFPLPTETDDEQAWVDRLLLVSSYLDKNVFVALEYLSNLKGYKQGSMPFMAFADICERYNGGVMDQNGEHVTQTLHYIVSTIASKLGEVEKVKKDLMAFANANEPRLYKLYRTCVDISSGLAAIVKARNELLRRIHQSHEDLLETMTSLVAYSSWNILNHSSIPPLIKRLQRPESDATAVNAAKLLTLIAKEGAPMYKTHVPELAILMGEKKNMRLVEVGVQGLSAVCKIFPEVAPTDRRVIERAVSIGLEGSPKAAKHAARFLAYSKAPEECYELINGILKATQTKKLDGERWLTYLSALAELALSSPKPFEARSEDIIKWVMNDVLLKPSPSSDVEGDEWIPRDELDPEDHAKLIALRVCTHWCLASARAVDAVQLLQPTLKLLVAVLGNDGAVTANTNEGGSARCHMRLRASLCLLKLAGVKAYDRAITQPLHFELIAGTMQDPCYMVRHLWLEKLQESLVIQRMLPRWNLMPALAAMDPDSENIDLAKTVMTLVVNTCSRLPQNDRIERVEMPLARLLHLLTHHPDFAWHEPGDDEDGEEGITDAQNLKDVAKFIELFLEGVSNRDNIGLLYTIAGQLKVVRDRFSENQKPLYSLSELAQIIIRNRAEKNTWSLPVYPGKIFMPRDIFHAPESPEARAKAQRTQYLSEEVRSWAKNLGKGRSVAPAVRRVVDTNTSPSRKRARAAPKGTRKKPRAKRDESNDPSSGSESEESEITEASETVNGDADEQGSEDGGEGGEDAAAAAATLGRGGKRGAKIKANRAVGKKGRREERKKREKMEVEDAADAEDESD
ncbi:hypothetical protein IAT38_005396 [Cryptococcus sp. DSM 104549]